MAVPYTFGSATTSIPLSQLDSNFATTITLGNTAIQLGNTVTTLNNMTMANVTISSGTSNLQTNVANATGVLIEANGGTGTTIGYNGFKNRIINGAMVIAQRGTGTTTTAFLNQVDQFQVATNAMTFTFGQSSTAPTGFIKSALVTNTSAVTPSGTNYYSIRNAIEGLNVADLAWGTSNAKTITLSFWVYSSLTGTFGGVIVNGAFSYFYPYSYTISSANTWEQKTITITGPTAGTWSTDNSVGIYTEWSLGCGSTYLGTAGSWGTTRYQGVTGQVQLSATNNATFYLTGVQLEKGSTATSFDYRPYTTELQLCQRYFAKVVAANSASATLGSSSYFSPTRADGIAFLPVSMRTQPSLSVATGTNYYRVYLAGATSTCDSVSYNGSNFNYSNFIFYNNTNFSGLSNGAGWWEGNNANSSVAASAEL